MASDFNMPHGKMSDFVLFPFFGFTLVIKLKNFHFESHWNTLIYFDKKNISDLIMSCQMSDLVFNNKPYEVHCFGNKLRNMNFEFHWNSIIC